jgi:hypothetical protein
MDGGDLLLTVFWIYEAGYKGDSGGSMCYKYCDFFIDETDKKI